MSEVLLWVRNDSLGKVRKLPLKASAHLLRTKIHRHLIFFHFDSKVILHSSVIVFP